MNTTEAWHTFLLFPDAPGILVPQKIYRSGVIYEPRPAIRFQEYGVQGISLRRALDENFAGMLDRDQATVASDTMKIACRLEWPGYAPWSVTFNVRDRSAQSNPISKSKLATYVARAVHSFMQTMQQYQSTEPNWQVQNIPFDRLILLELQHVSTGSWQPVLCFIPA